MDRYFTNDEKKQYQNWLENDYENEKWMFDREFDDNKSNDEEVKQEVINNAIDAVNELKKDKPEFEIGQIIYLEDDRKYRVEAYNRELD